ncbi:thiamine pyrophosphate-binding protein [bacterium]|nr:thiamine pyrophosphate-binding protein [bacterium]
MRNGGQILVESLVALGARKAFGVPGESYLAVLDAMHDCVGRFDYVLCRNEGGASFMAAAYGKLTGTPGICMVTRGPGASNAMIGVHTAMQDSTPMLLFVGQIARSDRERESFQEVDYRAVFGSMAKYVVEITETSRIPEHLARAWTTAISGRPGPVVVALPEDMLAELSEAPPLAAPLPRVAEPAPDAATLAAARMLLAKAKHPLILTGGTGWSAEGRAALQRFAEGSDIPVVTAFRCQDSFDNHSPVFAGEAGVGMWPHVAETIRSADVILALNLRMDEMTTGAYTLLEVPLPKQTLIHVHPSSDELGKIYIATLPVQAGPNAFSAALEPVSGDWQAWRAKGRAGYEAAFVAPPQPSPVDMAAVMEYLDANLPADVIVTNGAGNFAAWPSRHLHFGPKARLLAPQSGAMGYGVPAAIAASLAEPDRMALCFAGDGDFQMNCQELATAAQHGAAPIILILDNGIYGTIRAHQERQFPARVFGTTMVNPDFAAVARAYGLHGERVETTADFIPAFERAAKSARSGIGAVLSLAIAPEAIAPRQKISTLRASALAAKA